MKRVGLFVFAATLASAQSSANDQSSSPHIGVALTVGTLGAGIQVATGFTRFLNVRAGVNYFGYTLSGIDISNLNFSGSLRLESGEVLVDFFPVRWLHLSGGTLVKNGFRVAGSVFVPGGQTLTLNSATYYSSLANPVNGYGNITAKSTAPVVLFGFGNMLPRSQHHFSATVDLGVAFQGSPVGTLNFWGATCPGTGPSGCSAIASNPSIQSNITAEQDKVNKDMKPYNFYPIIQVSFGYKF